MRSLAYGGWLIRDLPGLFKFDPCLHMETSIGLRIMDMSGRTDGRLKGTWHGRGQVDLPPM